MRLACAKIYKNNLYQTTVWKQFLLQRIYLECRLQLSILLLWVSSLLSAETSKNTSQRCRWVAAGLALIQKASSAMADWLGVAGELSGLVKLLILWCSPERCSFTWNMQWCECTHLYMAQRNIHTTNTWPPTEEPGQTQQSIWNAETKVSSMRTFWTEGINVGEVNEVKMRPYASNSNDLLSAEEEVYNITVITTTAWIIIIQFELNVVCLSFQES